MDIEGMEKLLKLVVDLKLESSSLMWAAIAYFALGFLKSVVGYVMLGVVGIYFLRTLKWALGRMPGDG